MSYREILQGMDAAQMEESFGDEAWSDEADYRPVANTSIEL